MALVVLSVVEQRLGRGPGCGARADVVEAAALVGCIIDAARLAGLVFERAARAIGGSVPSAAVVSASGGRCGGGAGHGSCAESVAGGRRIRLEMLRKTAPWTSGDLPVPRERTIDRLLNKIPTVIKNRAEYLGSRDINRDAKWRRLAMNEGPGGDIGASRAAWRC